MNKPIPLDKKRSKVAAELRKLANEIEAGQSIAVRYCAITDTPKDGIVYLVNYDAETWGDVLKMQGLSDVLDRKIIKTWSDGAAQGEGQ